MRGFYPRKDGNYRDEAFMRKYYRVPDEEEERRSTRFTLNKAEYDLRVIGPFGIRKRSPQLCSIPMHLIVNSACKEHVDQSLIRKLCNCTSPG